MMVWSHLSCMLTNPGTIGKDIEQLQVENLSPESAKMYEKVQPFLEVSSTDLELPPNVKMNKKQFSDLVNVFKNR